MAHRYSPTTAKMYSQLEIIDTTYELSFHEMHQLLGDLHGQIALDYGTGAGRSARFLRGLGAEQVIGVDANKHMLTRARADDTDRLTFLLLQDQSIALSDNTVDVAISAHVFVEMRTLREMQQAVNEIARVLRDTGRLIVVSTNPAAIGHEFKSYRYEQKVGLKSGDPIACHLKGEPPFTISDTYWTEDDYRAVLTSAGFQRIQTTLPLASGKGWLDERLVAPDLVLACSKA